MAVKRQGSSLFFALALAPLTLLAPSLPLQAQETILIANEAAEAQSDLPAQLSAADAELYRRIFALQAEGQMSKADQFIARVEDQSLMGHVLAQRYLHPTAYVSKYSELKAWLTVYADHPQARRIYELALKKQPKGTTSPDRPIVTSGSLAATRSSWIEPYRSPRERSATTRQRVAELRKRIWSLSAADEPAQAQKVADGEEAQRLFDEVEIDQAYARIAQAWYFEGEDARALALAEQAAARSGALVPNAHWYAGLAAWRLGAFDIAARHFEAVAQSGRVNSWLASAGAYWAARSHLRLQDPAQMSQWLSLAAEYPRTFYGLLARDALGIKTEFDFRRLRLTDAGLRQLKSAPNGVRALALLQVGEHALAEQELLLLDSWDSGELPEALLAIADQANLTQFSFRLANRLADAEGRSGRGVPLLAALYPVPSWEPPGGFIVDRALVYALVRQESAFDPDATSRAGARGLMQIMPATASYVAGDPSLKGKGRDQLYDPALNLRLGQEYILHLMTLPEVGTDLFRLCAAYNGGPGNLARWSAKANYAGDPLLFIESLPASETRDYIERVLANLWLYQARLGEGSPALTQIADGDWPSYHGPLGRQAKVEE